MRSDISAVAVAIDRSIDRSSSIEGRRIVAWRSRDTVLHIAVGSCDDNLEFVAPLAGVDGVVDRHWSRVEDTLDVRGAGGIVVCTSSIARIGLRISLEVDIDGVAASDLVALVGTGLNIIRL